MTNIATRADSQNLNYTKIIYLCLDEDTVPWRSQLTEERRVNTGRCGDIEVEVTCAANKEQLRKVNRLKMMSEDSSGPIMTAINPAR